MSENSILLSVIQVHYRTIQPNWQKLLAILTKFVRAVVTQNPYYFPNGLMQSEQDAT